MLTELLILIANRNFSQRKLNSLAQQPSNLSNSKRVSETLSFQISLQTTKFHLNKNPMPNKLFISISFLLLISSSLSAQEVLRRGGLVAFAGKPFLTYETTRTYSDRVFSYHAMGEEEILFQAHACSNWTPEGGDTYFHYYFPNENLEMILPARRKYKFVRILPLMVKEGVLDDKANLNPEALDVFVKKYHVPIPRKWGPRVHRYPILGSDKKSTHLWEYSPNYDPSSKQWK